MEMPLTARTGMCVNPALFMKCVSYTNTILVSLVLSTTSSFNFLSTFDVFKRFAGCVCDSASKLTASHLKVSLSTAVSFLYLWPFQQDKILMGGNFLSFAFCVSGPSSLHAFKTVLFIPCPLYVPPALWVELVGFFIMKLPLGSLWPKFHW